MNNDGGYKSRKMVMAYVTMAIMTIVYLLSARYPALNVSFSEFCMAILGAASIYIGGNTAVKWITSKNSKVELESKESEEEK